MVDVSVVIPVYNGEKYLAETLNTVFNQTLKPSEIIVVDDGSDDKSCDMAESFGDRVRVIKLSRNKGSGAARNAGILHANGEYLAFLDADDLWVFDKLEKQIHFLSSHPEIKMVLGNVEQFISPELPPEHQKKLKPELKKMPGYVAGTMLLKKETFEKVGAFSETLELGEYIDWFSRAKDLGVTFKVLDDVLLKRRIHNSNMGIYKKQHMKDYTSLLRAALARKRNADKRE